MTDMSTRTAAPSVARALVLAAVLGSGLLAGCSDDEPSADPVDTTTSSAPSESGDPSDLPSSSGQLPDAFPVEEVPVIDGEIGEVLENEALNSYLVKVYPDTDFATAFEDASTRLTDAGFEQGPDVISAGPTSSTADFTSDDWFVVITGGLPGKTLVQYAVYPAE
jgi:hypothetical protein